MNEQTIHWIDDSVQRLENYRDLLQVSLLNTVPRKGYLCLEDHEYLELINGLIDNAEAVSLLLKSEYVLQALSIVRLTMETTCVMAFKLDHYKKQKFQPHQRGPLNYKKLKKKSVINKGRDIIKEKFDSLDSPFYNVSSQFSKMYEECSAYVHPEKMIDFLPSSVFQTPKQTSKGLELGIVCLGRNLFRTNA